MTGLPGNEYYTNRRIARYHRTARAAVLNRIKIPAAKPMASASPTKDHGSARTCSIGARCAHPVRVDFLISCSMILHETLIRWRQPEAPAKSCGKNPRAFAVRAFEKLILRAMLFHGDTN